jgi:hypothetical protein
MGLMRASKLTCMLGALQAVVLFGSAGGWPAAAPADEAAARPAPSPTAPDPAALERLGASIGRVNIIIDNVFDPSNPAEDKRLYRWANRVHIKTRRSVVENILLFEAGEPFDPRLLEESARLLRATDFVAEAAVTPGRFDRESNSVDVDVHIRDAWTLQPDVKLGRKGGETEYGFGMTEENLAGTGKSLSVVYSSNVDRDETRFAYSDPNVAGTRTRLNFVFADTSDGDRKALSAGRPFFSLDSRWSVGGSALDDERIDSMYDLGEIVDQFRHYRRAFSLQGGLSTGLVEGRARRWLAGFDTIDDRFEPAPDASPPLLLPENRELAYPWIGLQIVADDFREMTELNQMGRTEDIRLGLDLLARLGYSAKRFGADRDATLADFSAHKGWEPGGSGRLLLFDAAAEARWETNGVHNAVLRASAVYYHRDLKKHLFSARLAGELARRLDDDRQVLLGGDSGLRGYPLRYQSGERSAVLTLEQRFFTDWYPFRLLRVGYALFFDAGRVWGHDPRGTPSLGTLYDFGIGLRLTSPRSSSGSVVHIDLAFPLNNRDSEIDSVQLIVEKKASF